MPSLLRAVLHIKLSFDTSEEVSLCGSYGQLCVCASSLHSATDTRPQVLCAEQIGHAVWLLTSYGKEGTHIKLRLNLMMLTGIFSFHNHSKSFCRIFLISVFLLTFQQYFREPVMSEKLHVPKREGITRLILLFITFFNSVKLKLHAQNFGMI